MVIIEGRLSILNEFTVAYLEKDKYRTYKRDGGIDRYKLIELIHILVELQVEPDVNFLTPLEDAAQRLQPYMVNLDLVRHDKIVSRWPRDKVMKYYAWIFFIKSMKLKSKKNVLFGIIKNILYTRNLVKRSHGLH